MEQKQRWKPWLYCVPALLLILIVIVFPIAYTGWISLTNMNLYHWTDYEVIGLANYARALFKFDSGFLSALATTLVWTGLNMVIQIGLGFLIALGLNAPGLRLKRVYKTLLMVPWAVPAYISILLWRVGMFNTEFGILNKFLTILGFSKVDFLASNGIAFLSCMALNLWMALPFMISTIDGALQSVDGSLCESATLDGAGFWVRTWSITVPAIRPIIALAILCAAPAAYAASRWRFAGRRGMLRVLRLTNTLNTHGGLMMIYAGSMCVFAIWNMKGYFDTIPREIEEASKIDGANDFQMILRIVLPLCGGDIRRFQLAEVFLFTAPGTPCVFYGDELGISGMTGMEYRGPMPWNSPLWDLRKFIQNLAALRKMDDLLAHGSWRTLCAEGRLYIYERRLKGRSITVALNAGRQSVCLPPCLSDDGPHLSQGWITGNLDSFGYAIWAEKLMV